MRKRKIPAKTSGLFLISMLLSVMLVFGIPIKTATAVEGQDLEILKEMSLEELLDVNISLISGSENTSSHDIPAAVYIITKEEIRRSGHQLLPELLRLVPGFHVARQNAHLSNVGSRGFSGRWANKLLVMIDGRSIHTPHFGGVQWDSHDIVIEDIERIEVIRGPGNSLWETNAINGIVNVITKDTEDTQGLAISATGGTELHGALAVRYGAAIGENGHFRIYGKGREHDSFKTLRDNVGSDDWRSLLIGFRADFHDENNTYSIQGDLGKGRYDEYIRDPESTTTDSVSSLTVEDAERKNKTGNILAHWTHQISDSTELKARGYLDWSDWDYDLVNYGEERRTFDIELQLSHTFMNASNITGGFGYRNTHDNQVISPPSINYFHEERTDETLSAFLQYEFTPLEDLEITLGSKAEFNDYTGYELQPSIRFVWFPAEHSTLWGAATRAVRMPSRADTDYNWGGVFPISGGGDHLDRETVWTYELGFRRTIDEDLSIDIAGFVSDYSDIISWVGSNSLNIMNNLDGETYGGEVLATWNPIDTWRLIASWSYVDFNLSGFNTERETESVPENQISLRSYLDITAEIELNCALYYYGEQKPYGGQSKITNGRDLDSFTRFDLGLSWQVSDQINLSIWGRNLLNDETAEYAQGDGKTASNTEVERSVFLKFTYGF